MRNVLKTSFPSLFTTRTFFSVPTVHFSRGVLDSIQPSTVRRDTQVAVQQTKLLATSQESMQGMKVTFYKRKLPSPPATAFSSDEGRRLFAEALSAGTASGFFKLIEQFRWFDETMLDCCKPLDQVKQDGITMLQAACLARCNGGTVDLHKFGEFSIDEFRRDVRDVCESGQEHIIVTYSRKAFLQTGDGHFSPIGAYHPEKDLVLILDTARFKYPPHWVPLPMLYEAMSMVDLSTGKPRGYMKLSVPSKPQALMFTLDVRSEKWRTAEEYVMEEAPKVFMEMSSNNNSATDILSRLVRIAPLDALGDFVKVRMDKPSKCCGENDPSEDKKEQLLDEIRSSPLYKAVSSAMPDKPGDEYLPIRLSLLILVRRCALWHGGIVPDSKLIEEWDKLTDISGHALFMNEVSYLKEQMAQLAVMGEVSYSASFN